MRTSTFKASALVFKFGSAFFTTPVDLDLLSRSPTMTKLVSAIRKNCCSKTFQIYMVLMGILDGIAY